MKTGVVEVEATVESLLTAVPEFVWNGEKLPVPVDEIVANVYGLRVRLVEDMSSAPGCPEVPAGNISGLLLTDVGEIWVNAEEARRWEGRRRFTVGHELGHHVMHQQVDSGVFCRSDAIAEDARSQSRVKDPIEIQADAFSAAMLMPAHLMRSRIAEHGPDAEKLRCIFGCSMKAMKYRLEALATD